MAGAAGTLSPSPKFVGVDDQGNPIAGGKVYSYYAGTTTPAPTFSDADLDPSHVNTNPIVLDSAGRATIFLNPGVSYKFLLHTPDEVLVWTQDNIAAVSPLQTGIDTLGTAGEALAPGQVAYLSSGVEGNVAGYWYVAHNANAYSSTEPTIGMVLAPILAGQTGSIRLVGSVTGLSGLVPGGYYYVGPAGALTATRPGFNSRLVGVADTTTSLVLSANPAAVAVGTQTAASVITTVGTIPLLPVPAGRGDLVVFMNNASPATIQGIEAADRVPYQRITIIAANAPVYLQSLAPGVGVAALMNFVSSGPTPIIGTNASATYVADLAVTGVWRMVAHEQGGWATPVFNAADYYAAAPGTWTVDAGDVQTCAYYLSGRSLSVQLQLVNVDMAGVAAGAPVARRVPGGFTVTEPGSPWTTIRLADFAGAPNRHGLCTARGSEILFYPNFSGSEVWTTGGGKQLDLVATFQVN